MYISRRQRLGRRRVGEPELEFSIPWPSKGEGLHMYVISEFTAFFPGRVELQRRGSRGVTSVPVREGTYHYLYMDSLYRVYRDYENEGGETIDIGLGISKVEANVAEAGLAELRRANEEGGLHDELILHDERWPGYFSGYGGVAVIRILTVKDEVEEVTVKALVGGSWREYAAEKVDSYMYRDYFEATVPANDLKAYYFVIRTNGALRPFGIDGLGYEEPWIVKEAELNAEPAWYVGTSYYLVFPDSFAGFRSEWLHSNERPRTRIGGNLEAAARRLDYIKELGVKAIYLTPIYVSRSYHRYDVIDHLSVDPELGGCGALEEFLKKAHDAGLKVILDLVVHHTSPCAEQFKDALVNGRTSKHWKWYRFLVDDLNGVEDLRKAMLDYVSSGCTALPSSLSGRKPFYETFANVWSMPKLNHDNSEVDEYLCDVVVKWLKKGVDGFRVDVAHGLPDRSMEKIYRCVKEANNEAPVIMEIMGEASAFPLGITANSAMNYEARGLILDFFLGRIGSEELAHRLNMQYVRLPIDVANSLYNLLGSHDTPRVLSVLGSSDLVMRSAVLEASIYGSISIYYGDEVGMKGGPDPDNRRPMVWSESSWDKELLNFYRELLRVKELPELRFGLFRARPLTEDGIEVTRVWGKGIVKAIVTRGPVDIKASARDNIIISRGLHGSVLDGYLLIRGS